MDYEPVFFITQDIDLLIKFKNEDEYEYYKGNVKKINYFGRDQNGGFINCHVVYDDGEEVEDEQLYNKDFENLESDATWKITTNTSLLIKYLVETNKEIKELKNKISIEPQIDSENVSESDYEIEEEKVKEDILSKFTKIFMFVSLGAFFTSFTLKVATDIFI